MPARGLLEGERRSASPPAAAISIRPPSPDQALPCMQASVRGLVAASFSNSPRDGSPADLHSSDGQP